LNRFPFTAAEVLSGDSPAIVTEFFKSLTDLKEKPEEKSKTETTADTDDEVNIDAADSETEKSEAKEEENKEPSPEDHIYPYLDYLFAFLDFPINLTSAGYWAKIANNLFSKRPTAVKNILYY
jgi:hypothetical protein